MRSRSRRRSTPTSKWAVRTAGSRAHGRHYQVLLANELAPIAGWRLSAIDHDTARASYERISRERGPTRAAYALRLLNALARSQGFPSVTTNGQRRIAAYRVNARDRHIPASLMPRWFRAAGKTESGDYLRLIALTGLRRGEASALSAADIDLKAATLTVRQPKSGKPAELVYLSQAAVALLRDAVDGMECSAPIFPADPRKSLAALQSIAPHSLHDIRRSFARLAHELGVQDSTTEALLRHAPRGVTWINYARPSESTMRAALERIARSVTGRAA